jgi:hypothetical protein
MADNNLNTTETEAEAAEKKEKAPRWHIVAYIIIAIALVVLAYALVDTYVLDHTELVNDTVTVEAGETYTFYPEEYFKMDDKVSADDFLCDATAVDTARLGSYPVTVTCKNKTYEITVCVEDTKNPVTTFSGRYAYTNDPSYVDVTDIITVRDATTCTTDVVKYERLSDPQAGTHAG